MSKRFERVGIDFRFTPAEVPQVLLFQRIKDRDENFTCQLVVCSPAGDRVMTRRVDLMSGLSSGALLSVAKELNELNRATPLEEWKRLLREAGENVINAHRKGRPFMHLQGEVQRPPEPPWLCRGLLRKNKPNCWLGASSTGKSTLAKAVCAYYATGYRFCDREMEQGVPMYLDWEDDFDSFTRTVLDVCRNLGVHSLPHMVWRDMHGYRLRNQLEAIAEEIDRQHVGLLVLDAVAAAGGATGEHMTWEAIALEMEECLGSLPPVTVLALDHVTGAEHRAGAAAQVPIKARGAERKLEYLRNQWSLIGDEDAARVGRHVVNWHHTKNSAGLKEPPFATEIIHRPDEISVLVRPLEHVGSGGPEDDSKTSRLVTHLSTRPGGRTARQLTLELLGHEPRRSEVESNRKLLERAVSRGLLVKDGEPTPRYFCRQPADQGVLIQWPGPLA